MPGITPIRFNDPLGNLAQPNFAPPAPITGRGGGGDDFSSGNDDFF